MNFSSTRSIATNRYVLALYGLIAVKIFFALFLILFAGVGLAPDEAQYWTWSLEPSLGYYSKPPGIAWQIWAGCQLFGPTELGVRAGAVILNAWLALAVYALARECGLKERGAFWAAILMMFSPLGFLGAIPATTDLGFILMWTLASTLFVRALRQGTPPPYIAIGALIAIGGLFKWTVFALWPLLLGWALFCPQARSKTWWVGVLLSLVAFLPALFWNAEHDWVTFRHVGNNILGSLAHEGASPGIARGNFLDFVGAQVGLLSPIFFVLLVMGAVDVVRHWKATALTIRFCFTTGAVVVVYMAIALVDKMQPNWAIYVYPSSLVLVAWYALEVLSIRWGKIWLTAGLVLSVVLIAFGVSIPYWQSHESPWKIPYAWNPFRHSLGWQRLPIALKVAGYNPEKDFLFGDKYQMTSLLSFYSQGQKRAYFFNLGGARQNQFSYWPSMKEEQVGQTGYFVLAENAPRLTEKFPEDKMRYLERLAPYFAKVECVGIAPLFLCNGEVAKAALIFRCEGYNGQEPAVEKVTY